MFGILALALVPAASHAAWIRVDPPSVGCSLVPPGYRCSTTTQIRFAYPREWDVLDSPEYSSLYTRLIWLSTQELNEPCSYTHTDQGVRVRCGLPLGSLDQNGALLQWGFGGRPGWSLGQMPGERIRIGGRSAKLAVNEPSGGADSCLQLGGEESLTLWITRKAAHNFYFMNACLRGPDLKSVEQKVRTMIASARFPFG
ncbi:MAG: hypothetical protein QOE91_1385 [Gaiellaceae bacterium]|nr:hypothetical protein [Gaiellaceae bacterium]